MAAFAADANTLRAEALVGTVEVTLSATTFVDVDGVGVPSFGVGR